ncbi:hypothetical protein INR49_016478 [Caranx melampygus]|nr:hypothetical protein INR49_016478 [Caranx melampygus]
MQVVRQCLVCAGRAARGFLQNHTDVSLLWTSKSVLRGGAACIRIRSSSEGVLFSSRKPGVQDSGEWTNTAHMSITSLSCAHAVPITQKVKNLSHDSLVRRAASVMTDSSSTFLSQTSSALIDALSEYSKAVHTRIALQKRYLASLGKLTPAEEDFLREAINGQRAEASDRLNDCKRFESSWINAVNLCKLAAEAAYTSGAEHASITVRTNIQVAQSHVEEAQKLSADTDKKLAETKVEEIQRMAEYAASFEDMQKIKIICKMQVVRQCSVCTGRAARGFLQNHTDVSLLRTSKSVLRGGAACIRIRSSSEGVLFSRRKPGVQDSGEWTNTAHMSITSLSAARGLCAVPFTEAVHTRIALQKRYLASLGKLTPAEEDFLREAINGQRAEASDRLNDCKRFESSWINAVNLCKLAAEAAYTSGAEHASITVRTNIQVAQSHVEEAQKLSADTDKKLAETKVEEIQRMAEYAASFEDMTPVTLAAMTLERYVAICMPLRHGELCSTRNTIN